MDKESLLSTRGLVQQTPSSAEIEERTKLLSENPIRLFYGETYDDKGNTIDSLKYYLFISHLADALKQEGSGVEPSILVADTAACRNVSDSLQDYYMALGEERAAFVERVNSIYNAGLTVVKMSDYIESPEFLRERQEIIDTCSQDPELMELVEKTVPESKVEIERKKGFMYSFDEISTILDLDVKVGPPREDLYDDVARKIARKRGQKELMSLFLTPTFPLGMSWTYFFKNDGIENHGITAYKAGSKRLQRNRVLIERSNPHYIRDLIRESFISTNPALPNPTLDIGIICEMARRRLEDDDTPITLADEFYNGEIAKSELKERVGKDVDKLVLSQF